jgi:hypothetical protein
MKEEIKAKILSIVGSIAGQRFHQGTFASMSNQYPSRYEEYNIEVRALYKELNSLFDKEKP